MTTRCSYLLQKLKLASSLQIRWNSSKPIYQLQDDIQKMIENETLKPRKHPGVLKNMNSKIPDWISEGMRQGLEDADKEHLNREKQIFTNYLFSRRLPIEDHEMRRSYLDIESKMLPQNIEELTEEEMEQKRLQIKHKVKKKLKEKTFAWKPIDYTKTKSLLYMLTRSPAEYTVLMNIFNEIKTRDPSFDPKTMFDFGSGVGSAAWAATHHWKNINEYLAVDISTDMNELSEKILSLSPNKIRAMFYRRYLPVSNLKHDLIVSAYSLMELPDTRNRLEVISKLWKKTNKYLVIVEQGTNAGFRVINEARDFIKYVVENVDKNTKYSIFAPCPHERPCPRFIEGKSPCNFLSQYHDTPLAGASHFKNELYSYIVLKKDEPVENQDWSRIVRPTIVRSKHVWCKMCTHEGKLETIVLTAKHGKPLYRCAKATKWGDRLPIRLNTESNLDQLGNLESKISEEEDEDKEENSHEEAEQKEKEEKIFKSKAPTFNEDY